MSRIIICKATLPIVYRIRSLILGQEILVTNSSILICYAISEVKKRRKTNFVHTSPIKALSNQKNVEFKKEFSDVGLMTGDVTVDPNTSCLVMTTEIWRNMQYQRLKLMREVVWVIFDEMHYMRDREKCVVWEESIVMAPKNSQFIFISAIVPNAKEFADWVAKAISSILNRCFYYIEQH